jgi:hypothetical protein
LGFFFQDLWGRLLYLQGLILLLKFIMESMVDLGGWDPLVRLLGRITTCLVWWVMAWVQGLSVIITGWLL